MFKIVKRGLKLSAGLLAGGLLLLVGLGGVGHIHRMQAGPAYALISVEAGRRLHVLCEGPEDAPFVLYDAGAFGIYADGWWIKEQLKIDHRVCLYDRAGMGWSDPVPQSASPSPDWHVEDIRRLRRALGVDAPFVLIGHSMAGLRLHAYANNYPDDLLGLVFIDAARPQTMDVARAQRAVPWMLRALALGAGLARIGLAGGASYFVPDELGLPDQQKRDKRRSIAAVGHHRATKAEIAAAFEAWPDAPWRTETAAEHLPVAVYANALGGGANGPVAQAARANAGFDRTRVLANETHVSLLNEANAAKIAADVRAMTQSGPGR